MKISTFIAYLFLSIFMAFIMIKIYEKQTDKNFEFNKKNIILILIVSAINWLSNIFTPLEIRGIASTIMIYLLLLFAYKDNWKKTLYYSIIISCAILTLEVVVALFLPLGIKNIEVLNENIFFKVGLTFTVNILLYLIMTNKLVIRYLKKIRETFTLNKMLFSLGIIGVIICNLWGVYLSKDFSNKTMNIILCITDLVMFIYVLLSLKNKYEKNISLIKENQLKQNLDLYSKIATEHKELKHNLMNDFLIIKSKLAKKDQEFINDIINKYKSNYDWVNDVTDIPEGLQGLVFLKKNQAEIKKVKFNLEYNIDKNIEESYKINNNFKLYETLGILFDNAIEGAYESKEKIINVVFSYNKNNLQISILNIFNNEVDLDKIGDKNYSTKNRGSGIGLNYIKRNNNKFKINQNIQGNIFITDIIINHKEKK